MPTGTPNPTVAEARDILALGKLSLADFKRDLQARPANKRKRLFKLTGTNPAARNPIRECHTTCARINRHFIIDLI